ncbi:MAG TPA: 50S ribosomal protein L24 [bacterium]
MKLRKARVKKGDQVQVISGKAKGQTGEVLRVDLSRSTVLIKEVNMVQRHTKPRRQGEAGGILPMESPIHLSNVLKYCESCERGVRKLCEKPADCRYYQARKK